MHARETAVTSSNIPASDCLCSAMWVSGSILSPGTAGTFDGVVRSKGQSCVSGTFHLFIHYVFIDFQALHMTGPGSAFRELTAGVWSGMKGYVVQPGELSGLLVSALTHPPLHGSEISVIRFIS